ncbi:hypothetical protein HK104_010875 [Borealophlyctis nickersoniae]|nr:hypothetical protein HK104_010875 [Borealophlyctis nickersoniae]
MMGKEEHRNYLELKQQLVLGTYRLTGAAHMMIRSHQQFAAAADKARDREDVKRLLLKRSTTKEQQLLVRQQLVQINQTGTVTDYTHRFDMLLMQLPQRDTEETYVTVYLNGLKDKVKRAVSINSDNLNDLLSLKSAALRYDQVIKPSTPRQQPNAGIGHTVAGHSGSACEGSKACLGRCHGHDLHREGELSDGSCPQAYQLCAQEGFLRGALGILDAFVRRAGHSFDTAFFAASVVSRCRRRRSAWGL